MVLRVPREFDTRTVRFRHRRWRCRGPCFHLVGRPHLEPDPGRPSRRRPVIRPRRRGLRRARTTRRQAVEPRRYRHRQNHAAETVSNADPRLRTGGSLMTGPAATAEALLDALTVVGIDFSVARDDLLEWLGNPEFTEYPAFATALLRLLRGHALRQPVFIDVIVGFYEQFPGNPSPRRAEDVDTELLKQAILDGFNERYDQQVTDFAALLKPSVTLFSGMPERRRVVREARRQREAAWRERYNTEAVADDLWTRTQTMRDDFAA